MLLNPDPDSQAVLRIRIRINNWLEAESGYVSNDADPDPTKTIETRI